ncbi:MFS transporter [Peribacillus sp. SCS-155]|uniref:MFS transporter n=1 Tax=Peribacillus sedimenti TaxID=3115297 RepID=UPI003906B8EC
MKELLKNRGFVFILLGNTASSLGDTFSSFVISWLVYTLTGSKLMMGGMMVFFLVSRSISLLWSGPYLDRWNRKYIMIIAEWVRAVAFLIPFILYITNQLEVWHLSAVLMITGLFSPLYLPSSMAHIGQLLPKEQLIKANSLNDSLSQIMMLVSPALSGLFLYLFGIGTVLMILVSVLFVSGFLLIFLPNLTEGNKEKRASWSTEFREGLSFYKDNSFLLWMAIILVILNICKGAFFPMFLPYIKEVVGGGTLHFGFFESFMGLGMLTGTLMVGFYKKPKSLRNIMLGSVILDGSATAVLGISTFFPMSLLLIFISAFCMPVMTVNNTTLYQKRVPQNLLGRVFAVRMLFSTIGTPLGAAAGGAIAEAWGIPALFIGIGLLMVTVASLAFLLPSLREVEDQAEEREKEVLVT